MLEILTMPERLKYVRVISIKDYSDKLTLRLQELGLIHVEELKKVPEEELQRLKKWLSILDEFNTMLRYVEGFVGMPKLVEVRVDTGIESLEEGLPRIYSKLKSLKESVETIVNNISKLNEFHTYNELLIKYLKSIPEDYRKLSLVDLNYDGDIFFTRLIKVKGDLLNELLDKLKDFKVVFITQLNENEVLFNVVGFKESLPLFNEIVNRSGCEVLDIPKISVKIDDYIEKLRSELLDVEIKLRELKSFLIKLLENNIEVIALSKIIYEVYRERIEVLLNALLTDYCFIVEGWLPGASYPSFKEVLSREFKYIMIDDVINSDREPPTKLSNRGLYKSFELITKLYGIPKYNEWDPTRLITYSFMVFFGLMLADVVYGVMLIIITKYLLDKLGFVDNPHSEGYVDLKRILMTLGFSSAFFGFLSNTYAGYSIPYIPSFIELTDPLGFIKLALIIGLLHVNLAHLLTIVRSIKFSIKSMLLSEIGLLVAEVAAFPYILWYFLKVELPFLPYDVYTYFLYVSFIGLALLIVGKYMALGSLGLFLWLFDVTGLLGDVFSYTRIAGIGLATYLMARSFNDLALMVFNSLSSTIPLPLISSIFAALTSLLIILLTNIINVAFGVIGSFVHSLRLCFVEFLPKFYEGGGREFKPLKIPTSRYVLVGFKPS